MQIKQVIEKGKETLIQNKVNDASLQAKILMQFILKKSNSYIIANGNEELQEDKIKEFEKYINKIINGTPIQYITNVQEFMKLNFYVDENVLIPQPDTEILVEEVINNCSNKSVNCTINQKDTIKKELQILDLCTGSGAIGVSLARYLENSKVTCTDISMKALQIAKLNAERNLVHRNMEFILSDLFEELQEKKFNVIVSNPPYIKTDVIKRLDIYVRNEPNIALDGGKDGLDFYKKIANESCKYLIEEGTLFLEIGYDQKEDVVKILENTNKYKDIICKKDLAGNDRIIVCKKKVE